MDELTQLAEVTEVVDLYRFYICRQGPRVGPHECGSGIVVDGMPVDDFIAPLIEPAK
jgi:hypothetical protein